MVRRLGAVGLPSVIGLAAFAAVAVVIRPSPLFLAVAAVIAATGAWRATLVLRVDAQGVRLGRGSRTHAAVIPWSSVESVAVLGSLGGAPEVGVRLRPDAPLPAGVRGIVHHPDGRAPIPPALRVAVPGGKLDRAALACAVGGFGGGAALVDEAA